MNPRPRLAILAQDRKLLDLLQLRLQSRDYQVIPLPCLPSSLGAIYTDPPDALIVDLPSSDEGGMGVIRELKADSNFGMIPVLGLLEESGLDTVQWEGFPLDDFITRPLRYPELFSRIPLLLLRNQRIFDNNPLTKLPGNTSIQVAVEKALGKPWAVCYLDINHFKAYNDTYGFARGDEVIRMVGRIQSNSVRQFGKEGFSGHIGGDDFVFVVPIEQAEPICRTVIRHFNHMVSDLFGEEERSRGYYLAKDRAGVRCKIPLLGVAIAVVPTASSRMGHYGKVAEVAAELKCLAKQSPESRYVVDRRGGKTSKDMGGVRR